MGSSKQTSKISKSVPKPKRSKQKNASYNTATVLAPSVGTTETAIAVVPLVGTTETATVVMPNLTPGPTTGVVMVVDTAAVTADTATVTETRNPVQVQSVLDGARKHRPR